MSKQNTVNTIIQYSSYTSLTWFQSVVKSGFLPSLKESEWCTTPLCFSVVVAAQSHKRKQVGRCQHGTEEELDVLSAAATRPQMCSIKVFPEAESLKFVPKTRQGAIIDPDSEIIDHIMLYSTALESESPNKKTCLCHNLKRFKGWFLQKQLKCIRWSVSTFCAFSPLAEAFKRFLKTSSVALW